jgi:predicted RNase H-like HicB family nuclease
MSCTERATGCHICAVEKVRRLSHAERVSDRMAIVFEVDEDGWMVASIPAVRGVHSQGRTREEACANVLEALCRVLELRTGQHWLGDEAD